MFLLFRFVITLVVAFGIVNYVPGITIKNEQDAVFFGVIVSALNAFVRPFLVLLTLPITIITLGLFTLVINIFTFWLATKIGFGVEILDFSAAFWGGFILWVASIITNRYIWRTNIY